ncbi:hypothetical protein [Haloquadratum walsbyi]|nr:hypothetical protein [Haloquadratum walsbyi]
MPHTTDEDLLSQYDSGMHIGYAETAVDSRSDIQSISMRDN